MRRQTNIAYPIPSRLYKLEVECPSLLKQSRTSQYTIAAKRLFIVNSLEAPSNGIFRLRISSVGYQSIEREVTLRRNLNQDLGNLLMSPEAVMLKEAVVTGRAAQVVVKKDTLVYNPEAYRTPEGSPIE